MRRGVDAEVPRTPAAARRVPGIGVAVRGGLAMDHRAVAGTAAGKVPPLDAARKSMTLRDALNVDAVSRCKALDGNRLPYFKSLVEPVAELAHEALRLDAGLLEV